MISDDITVISDTIQTNYAIDVEISNKKNGIVFFLGKTNGFHIRIILNDQENSITEVELYIVNTPAKKHAQAYRYVDPARELITLVHEKTGAGIASNANINKNFSKRLWKGGNPPKTTATKTQSTPAKTTPIVKQDEQNAERPVRKIPTNGTVLGESYPVPKERKYTGISTVLDIKKEFGDSKLTGNSGQKGRKLFSDELKTIYTAIHAAQGK